MAAVTVNRQRTAVFGDRRVKLMNISIANDQDTLVTSGFMRSLEIALADGSGTTVVNTSFTVGGAGPITFRTTGGAQNNVDLMLIGR
jgi:hypothetical protein